MCIEHRKYCLKNLGLTRSLRKKGARGTCTKHRKQYRQKMTLRTRLGGQNLVFFDLIEELKFRGRWGAPTVDFCRKNHPVVISSVFASFNLLHWNMQSLKDIYDGFVHAIIKNHCFFAETLQNSVNIGILNTGILGQRVHKTL